MPRARNRPIAQRWSGTLGLADAANGMGVLLVQQHRATDAIRWFEQALAGSPRFTEARLNLGIAYQEAGNRDKAIEMYRRVQKETPPDAREHRAASDLLRALENSDAVNSQLTTPNTPIRNG